MNVNESSKIEQGTEEWAMARMGRLTASVFYKAVARQKNGNYYASREEVMADLMAERISMSIMPTFKSPAMQWGIDQEKYARKAYSIAMGVDVQEVGFIQHPRIKYFGASPDGLIYDAGGLEIKCPHTSEHIRTIVTGEIKPEYIGQMYVGGMCTVRPWWDFVSYDPRIGGELSLYIQHVEFDPSITTTYEREADLFLDELDDRCRKLLAKYPVTKEIYETNWN